MAIFHLHAKMIGRSSARSSVAAVAYRAGEKLHNERDGLTHDFSYRTCVKHSEIMLPEKAPTEFSVRTTLWNTVEKSEKRCDAQTAREIEIALPIEFDLNENISLVREYTQNNFVDRGMCADFSIHDKGDGNPHAHIMLTTRKVSERGFGGKNRNWNDKRLLEQWREKWADKCNERLREKGLEIRIDHRTLAEQGIDREPTIHEGRSAENREINQAIIARNKERTPESTAEFMHEVKECYVILNKEIATVKYDISLVDQQQQEKSLQDYLASLLVDKENFENEYARQKLLADINRDRQRILDRLEYLKKESKKRIETPREQIARTRHEQTLEVITAQKFKEIIQEVMPEQARAISERRELELEKAHQYERDFHGR